MEISKGEIGLLMTGAATLGTIIVNASGKLLHRIMPPRPDPVHERLVESVESLHRKVSTVAGDTNELRKMHAVLDSEGRPIWYSPTQVMKQILDVLKEIRQDLKDKGKD